MLRLILLVNLLLLVRNLNRCCLLGSRFLGWNCTTITSRMLNSSSWQLLKNCSPLGSSPRTDVLTRMLLIAFTLFSMTLVMRNVDLTNMHRLGAIDMLMRVPIELVMLVRKVLLVKVSSPSLNMPMFTVLVVCLLLWTVI